MKKYLFSVSFLSLVLFVDYILIVLVACAADACGAESQFFQGAYKFIGLTIIGATLMSAGVYLRQMLSKLLSIN